MIMTTKRSNNSRRETFNDLGCVPPEDGVIFFNPEVDDDDTVVMGNLDERPPHVSKMEKLNQLSSIPQEEKDARDRQLIQMYTRPQRNSSASWEANVYNVQDKPAASVSGESSVPCSPSTIRGRVAPEQLYPYYDLVVAEPSKLFDEAYSGSQVSPASMSAASPKVGRNDSSSTQPGYHEVIVPPFTPKYDITWRRVGRR